MNGHGGRNGSDMSGDSTQAVVQNGGYRGGQRDRRPARSFPHIKDLNAEAGRLQVDRHASISRLLQAAQESLNRSKTAMEFRRPDHAYVEHLKAFDIVVNIIPIHRDYGALQDRGEWSRQHKALIKELDLKQSMINEIKSIILEDNARTGVQPALSQPADYRLPSSRPSSSSSFGIPTPTSTPPPSGFDVTGSREFDGNQVRPKDIDTSTLFHQHASPSPSPRQRPMIRPKPEDLHGQVMTGEGSSPQDPLAERFAKLRIAQGSTAESDRSRTAPSSGNSHVSMPSPTDFMRSSQPRSGNANQGDGLNGGSPTSRLSGPRQMPLRPSGPPHPPKIPLETSVGASMPKAPSPTYSPVTSLPGQPSYNPHRSSTESNSSGVRNSSQFYQSAPESMARTNSPLKRPAINNSNPSNQVESNNFSSVGPLANGNRQYQTPQPIHDYNTYASPTIGVNSGRNPKGRTIDLPDDTVISAEKLFDYIKQYHVLLIDVRSRGEFDQGHIFSKSIICIEPFSLRAGLSADELEESLVLSPESEQALFERRDEFDLVVFYDQSTSSTATLASSSDTNTAALRALFDTLYEFNYTKQLKDGRPPILLAGGLDAWIDLIGPQSLQASETAAIMGSTRTPIRRRPARLARNPTVNANSSLEIRRRRLRAHKPMTSSEQEEWLRKATQEVIDPSRYTQSADENEGMEVEPTSTLAHTYEEFFRRFPEPSDVQQSMTKPILPPPILPSNSLPDIPHAPSRPPPTIPRPSYHGTSDNTTSQLSLARQTSAQRPPLYFPAPQTRRKLPLTGLKNYGVTCYLSATVQCLNATLPLTGFFLSNRWKYDTQKHNKGSSGNLLPFTYANLIQHMWANDTDVVGPRTFREFFRRQTNKTFVEEVQHDASEFLYLTLDYLHSDLNRNHDRTPLKNLTAEQERVRESLPAHQVSGIEWNRYLHRDYSFISTLFAGQESTRDRCLKCGYTKTTYASIWSLNLPITNSANITRVDITTLLGDYYCKEEIIEWDCPNCKEKPGRFARKLTLTRPPQFLCIAFKRFQQKIQQNGRGITYKLHTQVDFPLYNLDMGKYSLPRSAPSAQAANVDPSEAPQVDPATTPPFLYDAYAVTRHHGKTLDQGHYTACCKDSARGKWFKFDDETVTEMNVDRCPPRDRLQNNEAYIVFYERAAPR